MAGLSSPTGKVVSTDRVILMVLPFDKLFTATALILVAACTGCSAINVPSFQVPGMGILGSFGGSQSERDRYQPIGDAPALPSESLSESVYYKVRQAKAENGVVLQIVGDDDPIRILPMPPENSGSGAPAVFVSTLLRQTGVHKKLGHIEATLYRASPETINGVRMDVHFKDNVIRPETDYSLQPGDRLVVKKADRFALQNVIDMTLGR